MCICHFVILKLKRAHFPSKLHTEIEIFFLFSYIICHLLSFLHIYIISVPYGRKFRQIVFSFASFYFHSYSQNRTRKYLFHMNIVRYLPLCMCSHFSTMLAWIFSIHIYAHHQCVQTENHWEFTMQFSMQTSNKLAFMVKIGTRSIHLGLTWDFLSKCLISSINL